MHILALSGSLRVGSSNAALLRRAARLPPAGLTVTLYDRLGDLPHFSPDLQDELPAAVRAFRAAVDAADGLLISCPEYAHGVPGAFKNALDWLVGGPEFLHKPVAFLNVSDRGSYAMASLAETIGVMTGRISATGSYTLPLLSGIVDDARLANEGAVSDGIRAALARFTAEIGRGPQ